MQQPYPAEIALAKTRRDPFTVVVQLYKKLGGGLNLTAAHGRKLVANSWLLR